MGIIPPLPRVLSFCKLGPIKSDHCVKTGSWKVESGKRKAEKRKLKMEIVVVDGSGDIMVTLSSSRLKLPLPTNQKFSDSLVLVVEPLTFCRLHCWLSTLFRRKSLSTRRARLTPLDRVIGFAQPKSNVQRFVSLCFFAESCCICRENTRLDGKLMSLARSREMLSASGCSLLG